jgi:6-phosphogluconate dehydrogenase
MLPDSSVVTGVLEQVLPPMRSGGVVVEMSSSQPLSTRELAARAAEYGVTLVDAPVSGGVTGAERSPPATPTTPRSLAGSTPAAFLIPRRPNNPPLPRRCHLCF